MPWPLLLALAGCLTAGPVPERFLVADPPVEAYAARLMQTILAVTPHAHLADRYSVHLARLDDWRGFGGLATGPGILYVDAGLVRRAFEAPTSAYAIVVAMILAHEIGHVVAGHPAQALRATRTRAGPDAHAPARELEADRLAMGYWQALGWPCRLWTVRFEADVRAGRGTSQHPTSERLGQAVTLCGRADPDALTVPTSEIMAR